MLVSDLFLSDDDELKNWSHIIKTEMKCMFCSQWGETRLKCFELSSTKTMKEKKTPEATRWDLITDTVIDPYPAADECVCRRQVSQESIVNKMSPSNLACVFGVNLVWPRHGSISLSALMPINVFTEILIEHFHTVFGSRGPAAQVTPWRTCSSSGLHRSAGSLLWMCFVWVVKTFKTSSISRIFATPTEHILQDLQVEQDVFCWCREDPILIVSHRSVFNKRFITRL